MMPSSWSRRARRVREARADVGEDVLGLVGAALAFGVDLVALGGGLGADHVRVGLGLGGDALGLAEARGGFLLRLGLGREAQALALGIAGCGDEVDGLPPLGDLALARREGLLLGEHRLGARRFRLGDRGGALG